MAIIKTFEAFKSGGKKTLLKYIDGGDVSYTILDGDFSKFDGVIVNSSKPQPMENEFVEFFYKKGTNKPKYQMSEDPTDLGDYDIEIEVEFLPY